jgi:hydroxymethylbilane synthase
MIAVALEKRHPGLKVELVLCKTTGDKMQDRPLHEAGGKGLFTKELEEALLAQTVDFAVHSFKDVPVTMPVVDQLNLIIAAVPTREDVRDVIVSTKTRTLKELPRGAKVGTGSLRRRCQILAIRPDLQVEMIRGNIDTRIRKLRAGDYDAVILALAGVKRAGLFDETLMTPIPLDEMIPAAAQGALAIQCRKDDVQTRELLATLDDPQAHACVALERDIVHALNGDCHSPIAALATMNGQSIELRAVVGRHGGERPVIRAAASARFDDRNSALDEVMSALRQQDVDTLLRRP